MKVYLASAFDLVPQVRDVERALRRAGHVIAVYWWSTDGFDLADKKQDNDHPDEFYAHPLCRQIFLRNFGGVMECDALVLVAGDEPRAFNGANIEVGIALAYGVPCFSLGRLDNSVMYYRVRQCRSIPDLVQALAEAEK